MTSITGISHLVLTVRDLDRSQQWYKRALNASTIFRGRVDVYGFEVAYLVEPTSGAMIGLTQHDTAAESPFSPFATGLDHLSFAVAERADLERWSQRDVHMHCLNPDRVVVRGGVPEACAGAIADLYAMMGGRVTWYVRTSYHEPVSADRRLRATSGEAR